VLIHLIETGRDPLWHPGSTFWSAGAHAALVVSVVAAASFPAREKPRERVEREVVYVLPSRPSETSARYSGGDDGAVPRAEEGPLPVQRGRGVRNAADPVRSPIIPVVMDSVEFAGNPVFVAAELDKVVERDPASAAPAYPPDLEQQQVEGAVAAEWVVDTSGHADTTSFRVVAATHPGFVDAVRAALPLMRFRPAEIAGRHVAQMVRQEFTFRIHLPEPETPARVPRL
jgi:hypothetical protein